MFPTITIPKLHREYRIWVNELSFYKEEVVQFEKNLQAVVNKSTGRQARALVEHFQNRFIREKEVIDELKHKLHSSERQLAAFVKELSGLGLECIRMDNHVNLRDEMRTFRRRFTELKTEFRRFEAGVRLPKTAKLYGAVPAY